MKDKFDIVIPVGPHDENLIKKQLVFTKKNIIGFRNIYLICYDNKLNFEDCITIDEKIFPFNLDTVKKYHGELDRNGWYLQQLLKLYAGIVIKDILDKYLVIDSDTFFLKPTIFLKNNNCMYNYGIEYHKEYFRHMKRLSSNFFKMDKKKSGICHHMIFETKYIKEIFNLVEKKHNDKFYNVFLKLVNKKHRDKSGASEYELYFNYMLKNHNDKIILRKLKWLNTKRVKKYKNYDYVSYHWYLR